MATTAQAIIATAFDTLGVYAPGASISAADANDALGRLNRMMGALALQPLTQPVNTRQELALTANKGGPSNPYTIGAGGDFNTTRPIALLGAGILLVQSDPTLNTEVPRALLTDDAWEAIAVKELTAPQFTDVYYNPTFTNDRGTINLWPVPNVSTNSLVLYWQEPLTTFATLTTSYALPPGCEETLGYNLARRLLTPYGITDQGIVSDVVDMARSSLATFKRANMELSDLETDPALTHSRSGGYNIVTGSGG